MTACQNTVSSSLVCATMKFVGCLFDKAGWLGFFSLLLFFSGGSVPSWLRFSNRLNFECCHSVGEPFGFVCVFVASHLVPHPRQCSARGALGGRATFCSASSWLDCS
mgnify:CR=1 FL=1